jgi:hypothetical protein
MSHANGNGNGVAFSPTPRISLLGHDTALDTLCLALAGLADACTGYARAHAPAPGAPPAAPAPAHPGRSHSLDYRTCIWDGAEYVFTRTQAACVRVLWEAADNGTAGVDQHTVLTEAESFQGRLDHVFRSNSRMHPAWGVMIQGLGHGLYRLAP